MKSALLLFTTVIAISSGVRAADFPHRVDMNSRSKAAGVGHDSVALLQRMKGPGADAVASQLLSRWSQDAGAINTGGPFKTSQRNNDLHYIGSNGWSLRVYADGTAAEYRNVAYRDAHRVAVDRNLEPTLSQLSAWGRDFIANNLSGIVSLAPNEALVEHNVWFERDGSQLADGSQPAKTVTVGAIVVFSRTVDGVDVVGGGSKVAVFLTMDGTPWGFKYDWPAYSASSTRQQTLNVSQIRAREQALSGAASSGPMTTTTERHFECGYFDVGARRKDPNASIQTGCASERVFKGVGDPARNKADPSNGLFVSAETDFTPAGATVQPDSAWPRAARLLNQSASSSGRAPGPNTK